MATPHRPPDLELTIHRPPRWWRLKPLAWLTVAAVLLAGLFVVFMASGKLTSHLRAKAHLEARHGLISWDEHSPTHAESGFTSVTFGQAYSSNETRFTDTDMPYLEALQNVEVLDISRCSGVTARGLRTLSRLKNLRELTLNSGVDNGPSVTDAELAFLLPLAHLEILSMPGTAITDAGVASLSRLTDLEVLDLEGTAVTDASIPVFKTRMPKLRVLILIGTKVSARGVATLRDARTTLEIHHESLQAEMGSEESSNGN
ncbi:MAG TPA: hypothetical protein VGZ22_14615 [Isosphaeraceae bacterium]|jgi:hypothetical protein|nr:hypothetical protein [Isosphaeraceae bacterium]